MAAIRLFKSARDPHDLVHRDIKPANIMLRENGDPVVVDFGLVRRLDASSITRTFLPRGPGTPLYASPEQLTNDKELIDWRSDQFSLGVVLSMCSGGGHPYAGSNGNLRDALQNVVDRRGPSRKFVSWACAVGLPALVRMLSPWPVARFRQPQDLRRAWTSQRKGG